MKTVMLLLLLLAVTILSCGEKEPEQPAIWWPSEATFCFNDWYNQIDCVVYDIGETQKDGSEMMINGVVIHFPCRTMAESIHLESAIREGTMGMLYGYEPFVEAFEPYIVTSSSTMWGRSVEINGTWHTRYTVRFWFEKRKNLNPMN